MSLMRRAELTRKIRSVYDRARFHAASEEPAEKLDAALLELEAEKAMIEWGLLEIEGLVIDGQPANVQSLLELGPEELSREIAEQIRRDCTLTENERKN